MLTMKPIPDTEAASIRGLLDLLGGHAALTLAWDEERVTIDDKDAPQNAGPASPTLQARLQTIINAPHTTAVEIRPSLPFGSFAAVQKLNAAFCLHIEQGVPGAGTAAAIHELWENHTAQTLNGPCKQRFGPAHEAAVDVESAVMTELCGAPRRRVSVFRASGNPAVYVADYFAGYVVIAPTTHTATWHPRNPLASFNLTGAAVDAPATQGLIAQAVTLLQQNPRATAGVTGNLALAIRNEIAVTLREADYHNDDRGQGLDKDHDKGPGASTGNLRSFVDTTPPVGHGQITITAPM